ncbi:BamA/TamA family outer membrane protein [Lusitaniella coriacea LEGE 07157]|uniref:BamA/TamA family outer membrane protein n=1 Tax=Lusitaniella coriacea LEGE 07157 TaxID=945747 RepID=A0A8J7B841_9CYAN|nr:BamA/TamA family outer membrane protein [Lusitaniella coriacea]MBE9115030.1 BamA/TamA family outer membrane protein [Lusitaniella coriacea LEGE 07157]
MRLSSAAILTLAALAAGELTHPAIASEMRLYESEKQEINTPKTATSNHILAQATPVTAAPETAATPEFSQPTLVAQEVPSNLVVPATNIRITGASEELQEIIRSTIRTRVGGDTSQKQIQQDVNAILSTGLFASAHATSTPNPNGLDIVYEVNPVILQSIQLNNAQALTPEVVNSIFASQVGQPISPAAIKKGLANINNWYGENGYILAQVSDARPANNGTLTIDVAEGIVGDVNLRFVDDLGKPAEGRTQESYIRSGLKLQQGQPFRVDVAREDLRQLYQLGLFKKADIDLQGDAKQVDVTYELTEQASRGFDAGGGYSDSTGLFGSIRYNDQNVGGLNQQLGVNVQAGTRDLQFNANYGRAYRASRPDDLGYNVTAFRSRNDSDALDDVALANGDDPKESSIGGGVAVSKPIDGWNTSLGVNYARTSIRNNEGELAPTDVNGNQLTVSETGVDDLVTVRASVGRDERDNPINPTSGSVLNFSTEQSIPIGNGSILMNRLQANYSQYVPVSLLKQDSPEVLAFNVQGGTTLGDLAPYQAFTLGGVNSVRGYGNGDLATARSYVLASAEYRVPLFNSPVSGVLFADFASDLGSNNSVPGELGADKPGTGFGYGTGVRVDSPLGIIRADFGINNQGESRVQFGLGQRF